MGMIADHLLEHLLERLQQVQRSLDLSLSAVDDVDTPLAQQIDSMGLVEYVSLLADDFGVTLERYEFGDGMWQRWTKLLHLVGQRLSAV